MDVSNGHDDSDKTLPIPVGQSEVALVFDGRIIKPRTFKLDLGQYQSSFLRLYKRTQRMTRLAKVLQFFGLGRLFTPKLKLDDTQPIPPYTPAVAPTSDPMDQRYGRVGRAHWPIQLIGTDGIIGMTHAEWREYSGHKPQLFPGGPDQVRRFFDDHTIKPNDQS